MSADIKTVIITKKTDLEFFFSLKWMCKALSTDKTREVLHNIKVDEEGNIVATDGRRLHWLRPAKHKQEFLPEGLWSVTNTASQIILEKLDEEGLYFPNWQQVVPKSPPKFVKFSLKHNIPSIGKMYIEMQSRADTKQAPLIQDNFLTDSLGYKTLLTKQNHGELPVKVRFEDEISPIKIEIEDVSDYHHATAVVMPLRYELGEV